MFHHPSIQRGLARRRCMVPGREDQANARGAGRDRRRAGRAVRRERRRAGRVADEAVLPRRRAGDALGVGLHAQPGCLDRLRRPAARQRYRRRGRQLRRLAQGGRAPRPEGQDLQRHRPGQPRQHGRRAAAGHRADREPPTAPRTAQSPLPHRRARLHDRQGPVRAHRAQGLPAQRPDRPAQGPVPQDLRPQATVPAQRASTACSSTASAGTPSEPRSRSFAGSASPAASAEPAPPAQMSICG